MKIIVTGATGMVGEGVLHECLKHDAVNEVLIVNRKPSGISHAKLKEIVHADFYNLSPISGQLRGYDACFFCLGVSAVGMNEKDYRKVTHELTLHFAGILIQQNPNMIFTCVSGAGTDSSEKGRMMWARVKGKTENDLLRLPFKAAYMFRPGYIQPTKGLKNILPYYKYFTWLFPVLKIIFPKFVCTMSELGLAMIHCATKGYSRKILEVNDIIAAAKYEAE
jgi:uncharacterized protein YbjT (DUF2867 family)